MSTLPTSINLNNLTQYSQPVFDQLDLNSCVANAVCQAVMLQANEFGGATSGPMARLDLYYHTRQLEAAATNNPSLLTTDSGAFIKDALNVAINQGLAFEGLAAANNEGYDYKDSGNWLKAPTAAMDYWAQNHTVIASTSSTLDFSAGVSDLSLKSAIAQQLLQGKPVIVGSIIPQWLSNVIYTDSNGTVKATSYAASSMEELATIEHSAVTGTYASINKASAGAHAFVIVGYDDTLFNHTGGYIAENSWGESAGVKGFEYIPYDFRSQGFTVTEMNTIGGFNKVDQNWTTERGQIAMVYAAALNRAGESAGIDGWVAQMKAGKSLVQITESFVNSAEGTLLYGSLTDDQFIDKTYLDIRGRHATSAEISSGKTIMGAGESHGAFLYNVMLDTKNTQGGTTLAEHDFLMNRTTVSETYGVTYHADGNHLALAQSVLQTVTSNADSIEVALVGVHQALGYA